MNDTITLGAPIRIGEQLIREGLITPEQLQQALEEQQRTGGKIVANLVKLGHIDQRTFLNFLSRQPGVASINLAGYCISRDLLSLVPADFARKHELIPMDKMGAYLTVGMACPLDTALIRDLEDSTGLRVRALLVAPEAIHVALDKYYPRDPDSDPAGAAGDGSDPSRPAGNAALQQIAMTLTFEGVMTLVRAVSSLPAMPDTVQRVQAAVSDPDKGARDVAEILKSDPALAAKVISLANAPAHGFKHRVESIENATTLVGLREVFAMTLAAAIVDRFDTSTTFDYANFWRRSVTCGNLAKILDRASRNKIGTDVFVAGLLHDIGRAVFAEVAPAPYGALDHDTVDEILIAAEHHTFGIAHPEVGYIVARNWNLPAALAETIRFHACPERATEAPALVNLVSLAANLTDHIERPQVYPLETCVGRFREDLMDRGIDENQLGSILDIARALRDAPPD